MVTLLCINKVTGNMVVYQLVVYQQGLDSIDAIKVGTGATSSTCTGSGATSSASYGAAEGGPLLDADLEVEQHSIEAGWKSSRPASADT